MFRKLLLSASLIILVAALLSIFLQYKIFQEPENKIVENVQVQKNEVFLSVEENGIPNFATIEVDSGATAFDALLKFTEKEDIVIETKKYDVGIFIESIGGVKNGKDGKYWMYYFNENLASVSADKQELSTGDKIEFKFEKSPF